jgi:hypothetical protein
MGIDQFDQKCVEVVVKTKTNKIDTIFFLSFLCICTVPLKMPNFVIKKIPKKV